VDREHRGAAGAFNAARLESPGLLASQAAISIENARCLELERAARAAAEDAECRAAFLADATALLSESLDVEIGLARFAKLAVRGLSDWCVIHLIHEGQSRCVASERADVEEKAMLPEIEGFFRALWDRLKQRAAEARGPILLPEHTLHELCDDAGYAHLIRASGAHSAIVAPCVAYGKTLGAISLARVRDSKPFGEVDQNTVREIADRASNAIEHAQLYHHPKEAIRLHDEFFCMASHEHNTHSAALNLNLDSLCAFTGDTRFAPDVVRKMVNPAARQGLRLGRLVRDMLEVAQIYVGLLRLGVEKVELVGLTR